MKPALQKISGIILALQTLTGVAALSFFIYIGFFSRYWADDFCYIVTFENAKNIFDAIQVVYASWSNRYTNIIFVGMIDFLGKDSIQFFPGTMIILLVLAVSAAVYQAGKALGWAIRPLVSFSIGIFLTFLVILQTPNRFQSVYWMMGLATYFAPVVFIVIMLALLLWATHARANSSQTIFAVISLVILTFLAGGMSETTLAFQVTFFGLFFIAVLLFVRTPQRRMALLFSSLALLISLIALLVVFLAPGNSIRLEYIPESEFSFSKILLIFIFAVDFIKSSLTSFLLPVTISVLSAFGQALVVSRGAKAQISNRALAFALLALPLITYLLIASLVAPSVYVYGDFGYPESRALFPAQFVLSAALMLAGFLFGCLLAQAARLQTFWQTSFGVITLTMILFIVAVYPVWFLQKEIQNLPQIQQYSQRWDERNAYLVEQQQQGNLDIVLHGIQPPGGLIELRESPNFWVNICVADFYELNAIAVFP
jgi:hypothetical protein